jgi:phage tail sheath protein FI
MSVRPGVSILQRSTPRPRSAPTDTGVWYVTGLTDAGPTTPQLLTSIADYERVYGSRVSYSILYDALDVFFREGGARAYVARVVGPAATAGSVNLLDVSSGISLVASSLGPGAASANTSVGVRAGTGAGNFVLFVTVGGTEVETSPDLVDTSAAVLWAQQSQYIRLALGASALDPAPAAAAPLSAGTDDRTNITDTEWLGALNRLTEELGPGQVSAPGRTTGTAHAQLTAHARTHRRVAILDAPNVSSSSSLMAATSAARAESPRFGAMFAPWVVVPGVVPSTTRVVPPSALVAGLLARNDSGGYGPSDPAAGDLGQSLYAISLSQPAWDDTTRTNLNTASVNVIRTMFGGARVYGWRTLVDPVGDPDWRNFGNARLYMGIAANAASIAEGFLFDKIDGQGRKIAEFGGALRGLLMTYYTLGDLYGDTPDTAFYVDVGNQVNTPTTLANNELRAILNVKMSPFAEFVQIEIVKRALTEAVA